MNSYSMQWWQDLVRQYNRRSGTKHDVASLVRALYQEEKSLSRTASCLGVCVRTLRNLMKRLDLSVRSPGGWGTVNARPSGARRLARIPDQTLCALSGPEVARAIGHRNVSSAYALLKKTARPYRSQMSGGQEGFRKRLSRIPLEKTETMTVKEIMREIGSRSPDYVRTLLHEQQRTFRRGRKGRAPGKKE